MNFESALKIYYSVNYEWWSGMVKDEFEDSIYYVGPSEMRYFLYYNKFNYNYELNNELFTIQYELCDDLTLKHPEEYLKTLVDKPIPYVADLNKKQFELTSKYLSYWESELTYNPESELHKRRIRYLQTVRGELKYWFDRNNIDTTKFRDNICSENLFVAKKTFNRNMKKICADCYYGLLASGKLTVDQTETKLHHNITDVLIPELEKDYEISPKNRTSIKDYFRKSLITVRMKDKSIVVESHKR